MALWAYIEPPRNIHGMYLNMTAIAPSEYAHLTNPQGIFHPLYLVRLNHQSNSIPDIHQIIRSTSLELTSRFTT